MVRQPRGERRVVVHVPAHVGEERDELAVRIDSDPNRPSYSITSSARISNSAGALKPKASAVLRLIVSSNFSGSITGKSLGFAPFRISPTYIPARRNVSA